MASRFDPDYYSLYRPFYPAETFAGLAEGLIQRGFRTPFRMVDIGCGTGHSTVSLLQSVKAQVIGIDPDLKMLEQARKLDPSVDWRQGSGEATGLEPSSIDAVTIGSAFHWMDFAATQAEIFRVLKPGGLVRIFEYQFPKADDSPEMNEWIRREFNLRWRAPEQKPRGSLKELTSIFMKENRFTSLGEKLVPMKIALNAEQTAGLLLSQSRVLHYEDTLATEAKKIFRDDVRTTLSSFMQDRSLMFDFKLSYLDFWKPLIETQGKK